MSIDDREIPIDDRETPSDDRETPSDDREPPSDDREPPIDDREPPIDRTVRRWAEQISTSGPAAVGGLYDATATRLLRFAASVTRQRQDAEDALQSVMIKVTADPRRLANADRPWAFLLTMVRHEAISVMRRRRWWLRFGWKTSEANNLADVFSGTVSWTVDPIELAERHVAVWNALGKLPDPQREVVVLKIWEAMTFAQIADVLDISPDTAASRYRYAIEKLSRALAFLAPETPASDSSFSAPRRQPGDATSDAPTVIGAGHE